MSESMNDFFKGKVRAVTDADRGVLPRLSYSGLEVFKTCELQYNLKYNEKKRSDDTTLALELGSLLHKICEERINYMIAGVPINYDNLEFILKYGTTEVTEKTREHILGLDELKRKYFEEWYTPDNASGMTYEEKMKVFQKTMYREMEDQSIWRPIYTELPFEFVYKDRVIFNGFIDRIDQNVFGDFRTVDYKTSKSHYKSDKIATSLQFGIYALAIYQMFGRVPISFLYRFILIDEDQKAMTLGWEKRLEKALDNVLNKMKNDKAIGVFKPKPSPLCAWCIYSPTNPQAKEYKGECEYYSLWTPSEKRFDVNKRWNALDMAGKKSTIDACNKTKLNGRKLIF